MGKHCANADEYGRAAFFLPRGHRGLSVPGNAKLVPGNADLQRRLRDELDVVAELAKTAHEDNATIYYDHVPSATEVEKVPRKDVLKEGSLPVLATAAEPLAVSESKAGADAVAPPASSGVSGDSGSSSTAAGGAGAEGSYPAGPAPTYVKVGPPQTSAGGGNIQLGCASCGQLMHAPIGSALIKCPGCQKVSQNCTCGKCSMALCFLQGTALVQCPGCDAINRGS